MTHVTDSISGSVVPLAMFETDYGTFWDYIFLRRILGLFLVPIFYTGFDTTTK